jgi:hypothetical protein
MLSGVMEHFGLSKSLQMVAYYDSEYHQHVFKDLQAAIHDKLRQHILSTSGHLSRPECSG